MKRKSFLRQITPLLISLVIMGGLSLMVRKFEREAPRPFDRLIVEALPELPDLTGRPPELIDSLVRAHGNLEVGELQREALVELAYLYHTNGFFSQAESCYLGLESFETQNPQWPYLLGILKSDRRDQSVAAKYFARAAELDPTDSLAYLRLGDAYRKGGRLEDARTVYGYRLLGSPKDGWAMARMGQLAILQDDLQGARDWLEKACAAMPQLALPYELLPEVYMELGDVESSRRARLAGEARELIYHVRDEHLQFLPEYCFDTDRLMDFARRARLDGDLEGAVHLIERAVQLGLGADEVSGEMGELLDELSRSL